MKPTYVVFNYQQGGWIFPKAHQVLFVDLRAHHAAEIAKTMLAAMPLAQPEDRMTPKRIASFACDVARELFDQFDEREWLTQLPAPFPQEDTNSGEGSADEKK